MFVKKELLSGGTQKKPGIVRIDKPKSKSKLHSSIQRYVPRLLLHPAPPAKKWYQKITDHEKGLHKNMMEYLTISHRFRLGHKLWEKGWTKIVTTKSGSPSFSNTVNVTWMSCLPTKRLRAHVGSIGFLSNSLSKRKVDMFKETTQIASPKSQGQEIEKGNLL